MEANPPRRRVGDQPRDAVDREWEVFVREATEAPLRHVGSVSAPTAEDAHERATTLFARDATDVWLCPADAVSRYSIRSLDRRSDHGTPNPGTGEKFTEP